MGGGAHRTCLSVCGGSVCMWVCCVGVCTTCVCGGCVCVCVGGSVHAMFVCV